MAELKTYTMATVNIKQLHTEIAASGHVVAFDGLNGSMNGDDNIIVVLGTSADIPSLDGVVSSHAPI